MSTGQIPVNLPTPPNYANSDAFKRNQVRVVPYNDQEPWAQRLFPDSNRVRIHGDAATEAFAKDGEGFVPTPWSGLPPDRDYFSDNGQSAGGMHPAGSASGLSAWERLFDGMVYGQAEQLIADICADQTGGLSTITFGQVFHSHYQVVMGDADSYLILTADRGKYSCRPVKAIRQALATPESYAALVSKMHSELTGGV